MSRFHKLLLLSFAACTFVVLLVGCHSRSGLMADLFVPLPPTAPVKNAPRHPPPVKKPPMVIIQEEVVRPPDVDWRGIYQALPRDNKGTVDWMRALDEKLITPKFGIDPAAEATSATDSEITFVHADAPNKPAVFRHATHGQWLSCKNCHSGIFKKRSENLQFTHDDMKAGKYCGACHFSVVVVQSGCKGCHAAKKPATPAAAAS
ncbi:MAG TPA: c(7)-type cytochrome triheme domain-containing protein [Steroidobacteraceae bacterium]|nr:c(7)-type cytochrome triheme domain-containing protein [Steroidobacteraceae bacterium]